MGKNKVDKSVYIDDEVKRRIAFSKRKRVIIKQCVELSRMCGQDISLTIFDKDKQKLVQYCSSSDFNPRIATQLLDPLNV